MPAISAGTRFARPGCRLVACMGVEHGISAYATLRRDPDHSSDGDARECVASHEALINALEQMRGKAEAFFAKAAPGPLFDGLNLDRDGMPEPADLGPGRLPAADPRLASGRIWHGCRQRSSRHRSGCRTRPLSPW